MRVLDGVDLDVAPGEVHAVVGENGAGKSTLMKIVSGGYAPDEGTVEFAGAPRTFRGPRDAQRAGIGIIHQEFNLLPGAHRRGERLPGPRAGAPRARRPAGRCSSRTAAAARLDR